MRQQGSALVLKEVPASSAPAMTVGTCGKKTMIAIDTIAVEREFVETWLDRRELDYLIYNDPAAYAELVLAGDVKEYLDTVRQGQ